ncbi:MAG: hypothetical protein Q8R34_00425 [bacterium]|nr:hypothetical protein [bacterium]
MAEKTEKKSSAHIFKNAMRVLKLTWKVDRRVFVLTVLFTLLGAVFPIILSYISRIILDELVRVVNTAGIVTLALLSFFSFRYALDLFSDLQNFYHYEYLSKIFGFKMENALTFNFSKKMSELDIPHFESTETQNLIKKASEGHTWRIPSFFDDLFFVFLSAGTFIGAFLVLIPFGFWIPLIMTAATVPRFVLRNKYSKVAWNVYNLNIPESKDVWYLLSDRS